MSVQHIHRVTTVIFEYIWSLHQHLDPARSKRKALFLRVRNNVRFTKACWGAEWGGYRICNRTKGVQCHGEGMERETTYRFLMVTRCRENLSSGEKRAGWADLVTFPSLVDFCREVALDIDSCAWLQLQVFTFRV
jgi:hypothetical protein